jgi:pilus assembly protein CpaC
VGRKLPEGWRMQAHLGSWAKDLFLVMVLLAVPVFGQAPMASGTNQPPRSEQGQAAPTPQPAPLATSPAGPTGTVPQAAPETQTLHILVGRSVVINLQARLRRVLVSNPNVLETITINPTQLVVTAKVMGTSSLVLWDETGHSRILDVYGDADVSGLRDALQQAFPTQNVQVEAEQGRVILSGTVGDRAVADEMVKLASGFSKDIINSLTFPPVSHTKQIMLKVRFAEVDRVKLNAFGLNIFSTGAANTIGTISTGQFSPAPGVPITGTTPRLTPPTTTTAFTPSDLLNIFLFRPDLNLGTTIRDLENKNVLQILAEPNLLALSGQEAHFLAGGEFPIPVVQGGANVGAVTIQFKPFGVRLDFTGLVQADSTIRLKVVPEVSTLDFANGVVLSGFTVPATSTRKAETVIELKDGQSFGIAGLLDQRVIANFNKIPGIGDIPILGQLFRSRSVQRNKTELLVLVTPTVVDPLAGAPSELPVPTSPIRNLDKDKFDKGLDKPQPESKAGTASH